MKKVNYMLFVLTFLSISTGIHSQSSKCGETRAYYKIVCSKFEFWCKDQKNLLTYEAICRGITINPNDTFKLSPNLYDIEIHYSDMPIVKTGLFKIYKNLSRLYIQNSNTETIETDAFHGLENLDWLILKTNKISNLQRGAFGGLTSINVINLNDNKLNTIEDWTFDGVPTLKYLGLRQNNISNISNNAFRKLKQLGTLFLNSNNLNYLDPDIFAENSNLRFLWLQDNKLTVISNEILSQKPLLIEVMLDSNQLTFVNTTLLTGNITLHHNKLSQIQPFNYLNITTFNLSYNNISFIPSNAFYKSSHLKQILLDNNNIINIDPTAFNNLQELELLTLNQNNIASLTLGMFKDLSSLILLNISYNTLESIETGIFTGLRNLRTLDISNNKILLLEIPSLYTFKFLTTLWLNDNYLNNLNVTVLLAHLKQLRNIDIDNNDWRCDQLSMNLLIFDQNRVTVQHGLTYHNHNVHGIICNSSMYNRDLQTSTINVSVSTPSTINVTNNNETKSQVSIKTVDFLKSETSNNSATKIAITATVITICLIAVLVYVAKRFFEKRKIQIVRSASSETITYRLTLNEET